MFADIYNPHSSLSLNGNVFFLLYSRFCCFFRYEQFQRTIFKFGFDVFLFDTIAYIKASATGSTVTFTADVLAIFIFFIFPRVRLSTDCQITIFQFCFYIFLFNSRHIHRYFIAFIAILYIGFHQMWKLLKQRLTQPKQQKWVKLFQIAYLTGTVCWGYVHAVFMNVALIFKFTFEKYGDMQAAAEIANKVFYCNAAPLLAAYILCDVLLSVVMLVMIWKRMLPLKNTAQRILASFCNPIVFTGIVGNLFTLLPWPLDQIDHGTESAGHLLVLILGLVLLREKAKCVECKEAVQ